jgi:two-component system response regulator YesN
MAYKLIIVDDETEISAGFAQFFPWKNLGFEVVAHFTDASRAFEYMRNNPVDVVVSDVVMPGVTGLDLARMISEAGFKVQPYVLLFSAYDKFEYARKALKYKCTDYILKSSEYDELIEIFSRLKVTIDQERKALTAARETGQNDLLPDAVRQDKIISAIIGYIMKDPSQADLKGAADTVYMSPAYISHYFRQKTGMSFSDFLLSQKMRIASELLQKLQYKVYEISEKLGYRNPANFTRTFKKFYNMSPKDYRFRKMGRLLPGDEEEFD